MTDGTSLRQLFIISIPGRRCCILALQTDKATYHAGDTIYIINSVCKNRNYSAHSTWRLVNETIITFPDQGTKLSTTGCFKDKTFPIGVIPPYSIPGLHHLEGTAAITVNQFRTIYYTFRSVDFDVTE